MVSPTLDCCREEETRLDGPFVVGTSGWSKQRGSPGGPFTLAVIEPEREWTVDSPLPGGRLTVRHLIEPASDGRVRIGKRYEVHGPLTVLFRLYYGPKVRHALGQAFTALEERPPSVADAPTAPGPRGPLMSPGFWLHHAALAWRQALDSGLKPLGMTHTQFNLLGSVSWLASQPGPPTQQEAAELSGADRMMTSKVLKTLEDRNLLTRTPDPADARIRRLVITADGRALVHHAVQVAAEVDAAFFGAGEERERLRMRLKDMAELR